MNYNIKNNLFTHYHENYFMQHKKGNRYATSISEQQQSPFKKANIPSYIATPHFEINKTILSSLLYVLPWFRCI